MREDDFIEQLTTIQGRIYAYILSLIGDVNQAFDVLQEANLVLWKKADEFQPGSNFAAWALQVAYFQVLAFRKRQQRDRLVFNEETVAQLAQKDTDSAELVARQARLRECLKKLTPRHAELVERRYARGENLPQIAESLGETANAVAQALHRARLALVRCVRQQPAVEGLS